MKTRLSPPANRRLLIITALAVACLRMANSALANSVTVTTLADPHEDGKISLREAISAISPVTGGTVNFQAGLTGTIKLAGAELQISRNMTITGPGPTTLSVSGNHISRVFNIVSSTATVSISNLKIMQGSGAGTNGTQANPDGGNGEGGGILNAGALTLTACTIYGNTARGGDALQGGSESGGNAFGGGISSSGPLILFNCLVESNCCIGGDDPFNGGGAGFGGGIYCQGTLAMTNCTLDLNFASGGIGFDGDPDAGAGGGIFIETGGQLVNCTFNRNSTYSGNDAFGGGIYQDCPEELALTSCTISGNECTSVFGSDTAEGAGIYLDSFAGAYLNLRNTIVSGNTVEVTSGEPTTGADVYGTVDSGGFNLIGRTDGNSGWVATDLLGGTSDGTKLDPFLGPLQENGGTPTMALRPGSAAIDAGNCFGNAFSQNFVFRPFDLPDTLYPNAAGGDGSDIGAFELTTAAPALSISIVNPHNLKFPTIAYLTWLNTNEPLGSNASDMMKMQKYGSVHQLQKSSGGGAPGEWMAFPEPIRLINGQFMAKHEMIPAAATFFRTMSPATNASFIPGPVTGPASNITTTTAILTGNDTPIGNNTTYWFEYGTDTNYGQSSATNSLTTSSNLIGLNLSIGGLSPLTPYHFQLVVTDDWGAHGSTQYGGDQPFITQGLPPIVTTLAASSVGMNSATFNGTVNGQGSPTAGYFQYGTNSGTYLYDTSSHQFFGPADYSAHAFSSTPTNLNPNTTYYYRILAFGASEAFGAETNFTTAPQGGSQSAPTAQTQAASNVNLISGYTYTAQFNAAVNPNGADTKVFFQYGISPGSLNSTTQTNDIGSGTTLVNYNFTVTNLNQLASSTYYFQVVASNSVAVTNGGILSFPLQ